MQRGLNLAGKVAIVTGASRGLGQFSAFAYAVAGARVAVIGRNAKESGIQLPGNVYMTAEDIAGRTGADVLPIVCDVRDAKNVDSMVERVLDKWGRIDVLLNNAAYSPVEEDNAHRIALHLYNRMLQVNLVGALRTVQAVVPHMIRQRRGSIINVSCRSANANGVLDSAKVALETLSTGLARDLKEPNIAVNCLRPSGFIETPGTLINSDITPSMMVSPQDYLLAAVLLADQTADTYTGHNKTDAEVIADLGRLYAVPAQATHQTIA